MAWGMAERLYAGLAGPGMLGAKLAVWMFGLWFLCGRLLSAVLIGVVAPVALAAEDPAGFRSPQGYSLEKAEVQPYAAFTQVVQYNCAPDWKPCNGGHIGFNQSGWPHIEGKIERADYQRQDRGDIEALLLQRNYERVIRSMGGRLYAMALGNNIGSGDIQQVYLLESEGQVRWIHLRTTRYHRKVAQLTVVTLKDVPNILSAGELRSEMDQMGFITLSVNFGHNKADIRDPDRPLLDEVVHMLAADPALRISVDGHTDNVGGSDHNKALSQRRAESIVNYLSAAGIDKSRLEARGFGLESPVADNRTEAGRARNRRVELVQLK